VKKGPLGETSPMLNDVSAVPTWAKVRAPLRAGLPGCRRWPGCHTDMPIHVPSGQSCARQNGRGRCRARARESQRVTVLRFKRALVARNCRVRRLGRTPASRAAEAAVSFDYPCAR
jgi:hypothetical protein